MMRFGQVKITWEHSTPWSTGRLHCITLMTASRSLNLWSSVATKRPWGQGRSKTDVNLAKTFARYRGLSLKNNRFWLFSTPFSTFWAPGPRGPGNSFSDSFSNFGPELRATPGHRSRSRESECESMSYCHTHTTSCYWCCCWSGTHLHWLLQQDGSFASCAQNWQNPFVRVLREHKRCTLEKAHGQHD